MSREVGNTDFLKKHPVLEKVDSALVKFELITSVSVFVIMIIGMVLQVILRYVLNIAAPWLEEVIRILFVFTSFITAATLSSERDHINIDIIATYLNKIDDNKKQENKVRNFWLIADFVSFGICTFLSTRAHLFTVKMFETAQKSAAMQMPTWIVVLSIEVGFILMSIHYAIKIYNNIYTRRNGGENL